MALTIRERNDRYGTWANPLLLDATVDKVDTTPTTTVLRMGYDAQAASQILAFSIPRAAEIQAQLISADPMVHHVSVSLAGPLPARTGFQLIDTADGLSQWRVIPAGDWRVVVALMLPVMIEVQLVVWIRPARQRLRGEVFRYGGISYARPLLESPGPGLARFNVAGGARNANRVHKGLMEANVDGGGRLTASLTGNLAGGADVGVISRPSIPPELGGPATGTGSGGTVTTDGPYTVHTFTGNGTFVVSGGNLNAEWLIVGGGGSGSCGTDGVTYGGGGGGGEVVAGSGTLSPGSYTVVVGAGGAGVDVNANNGNDGGDSSLGVFTAGGGRMGLANGNGGASGSSINAGAPRIGISITGGGGGGAGGAASSTSGGVGISSSISGVALGYGGGGGGSDDFTDGAAVDGGGRGGGLDSTPLSGVDGRGGGGGSTRPLNPLPSGDGGDGIVIIRRLT
jgi:hypothetical protein